MTNPIIVSKRSCEDAATWNEELAEAFPFLPPDIIAALTMYSDFHVGIPEDDSIDPDTYKSFSMCPIEELYWRTDWKENGFFAFAMFYIDANQTDICIRTEGQDKSLYLWAEEGGIPEPIRCKHTIDTILDDVLENSENLPGYLARLTAEARA